MRQIDIINACTDLGVVVDGACLGPDALTKNLKEKNVRAIYRLYADEENKEKEKGFLLKMIKRKELKKEQSPSL